MPVREKEHLAVAFNASAPGGPIHQAEIRTEIGREHCRFDL